MLKSLLVFKHQNNKYQVLTLTEIDITGDFKGIKKCPKTMKKLKGLHNKTYIY